MMQVRNIWNLKIRHDFYEDGMCHGGRMLLSPNSELLLRKRGAIFKQYGVSDWTLITFEKDVFDDSDCLELLFICEDNDLIYNTEWDWKPNGICHQVAVGLTSDMNIDITTFPTKIIDSRQKAFFQLIVSLKGIDYDRVVTTKLDFFSKSVYREYWLIPRDRNINRDLELEFKGSDEEVAFARFEAEDFLNTPLLKFRSSAPIKLREKVTHCITLYEKLPSGGRRMLIRSLPSPTQGTLPCDRKNTVVAIAYF